MKVLVDADGCPVVSICTALCKEYDIPVLLFCDWAHQFDIPNVCVITVAKGADSADFALVNRVEPGDIVVTQDYGLAAMCLVKKAAVLNQNGLIFTDENISACLMSRHAAKKARMAGKHLKGPKKRVEEQNTAFEKAFLALLHKKKEKGQN